MSLKFDWKKLFNIAIMLFSIGLLIFLCFSNNGLVNLISNYHRIKKGYLILAILCQLLNLFIDCSLIYIFAKSSIKNYTLKNAFKTSMTGQFFSCITPGASGGQPMQVYALIKQGFDPGVATSTLVQKFLVYQTTITLYGIFSIFICFNNFKDSIGKLVWVFVVVGFLAQAIGIISVLLFAFNRILAENIIDSLFKLLSRFKFLKINEDKVENIKAELFYFYKNNQKLFENIKTLILVYSLCIIQITSMFIIPYFIYKSFDLNGAKIIDLICSQAFVNMISSFIPLPGASGASEGSFYVFFNLYFTQETIKSAILLWRFITYYLTILISAPFSRLKNKS